MKLKVSFTIHFTSFWYIPSGTTGLYESSIINYDYINIIFHNSSTKLYSHQQCKRVFFSLNPSNTFQFYFSKFSFSLLFQSAIISKLFLHKLLFLSYSGWGLHTFSKDKATQCSLIHDLFFVNFVSNTNI